MSARYVVKNPAGLQYVLQVDERDALTVRAWTSCQKCAQRFSRDHAHHVAHDGGKSMRVVQIRRRASKNRTRA